MNNVIVIGGMAAGCRAAARLSRLSSVYHVTIIEKGPFISFSNCGLPLYAAGEIDGITELTKTSYGTIRDETYFSEVKGVRVLTKTEVVEIDTEKREVRCRDLDKDETFILPYDSLIIATGSEVIRPQFPYDQSSSISSFHSPQDAINFKKVVQKGKIGKAVVIGGGFVGCELIESLSSLWGIETVLVEKEEALLSGCLDPEMSIYLESSIKNEKVRLSLATGVDSIEIDENELPVVILKNGQEIKSDYVFYCLGVKPNTELAQRSNIKIGKYGGITVDRQMRTNRPHIWAAGDCVEVGNVVTGALDFFALGSLSNRMGRIAADSIAGRKVSFKGAAGTMSLKLFRNTICASGLTETKAQELSYETGSVIGCWPDRPDYHPESRNLFGKLVYERPGMRLLGLQLVGEGEVTRYIDVFSELLSQGKTAGDLMDLEHGYTPAHSSPISPLNYLGFMACNQEWDGIRNVSPIHISYFNGIFIDVRETYEVIANPFPGNSIQIRLSDLHSRVDDFDKNQSVMFVCEKGPRSYEAARIFKKNGHKKVSYLGGGNLLYSAINSFSGCLEVGHEQ